MPARPGTVVGDSDDQPGLSRQKDMHASPLVEVARWSDRHHSEREGVGACSSWRAPAALELVEALNAATL